MLFLSDWIFLQPGDWRADNLEILGTALVMAGTFYLAYDLLGRHNGPLFWMSLFITTGLLGGMVVELIALSVAQQSIWSQQPTAQKVFALNDAALILLTGMFQGAFGGLGFTPSAHTA